MKKDRIIFWRRAVVWCAGILAAASVSMAAVNTTALVSPVKLVFIHHSTGGNWLADPNDNQPYGGLAAALMANNYYVSTTNYGWGPGGIGDRTDIVDWPDWFTGGNAAAVTAALYAETGQNIGGFGNWKRMVAAPDGENRIVVFKSCFPNSDLFGSPADLAGAAPNDQYTVSNAKAVYNNILTYFQTRPDKLFVVVTAPPLLAAAYGSDYQSPARRAENARAFNNWLVNDWLASYPLQNVGVFDYFNVLTGPDNHHRVTSGVVEHTTPGTSDYAYYPSGDSHPSSAGHQKATAEFVPLLNHYFNLWQTGISSGDTDGGDDADEGDTGADADAAGSRLAASDFTYKGAFRLPDTVDDGWQYGGGALTWYPDGDEDGPADGYPGSLFGAGYNVENRISEISIPVPVVPGAKNLSDLHFAATLQTFSDLKGPLSAVLDTPPQYAGITYLPAQGDQTGGKLYLTFGQHFQEFDASLLWCDPDLSDPDIAGPWLFGGYPNYVTNDYLFAIPETFATTYLFGRRLASGRHREGVWGGLGPTLFASAPWADGNPPVPGTSLSTPLPLLLYGETVPGLPEIVTDDSRKMSGYSEADYWSGGAWLTAGAKSAVAFIGTKATGKSWYGFSNGVVWDYDCADTNTCPDVPDWPYDNRGYWADGYEAQIKLYDPADIAAVARGAMQTWEPQPYATISLTPYLFDPDIDVTRYRRHLVGAMAFDDENGILYFFELLADGDKSLVHVFKLESGGSGGSGSAGSDSGAGDDTGSGDDNVSDDDSTSSDDTGSGNDAGSGDDSGAGDDTTDEGAETSSGGGSGGGCFIRALF